MPHGCYKMKFSKPSIHLGDKHIRLVWNTRKLEKAERICKMIRYFCPDIEYFRYKFNWAGKEYYSIRINKLSDIKKFVKSTWNLFTEEQQDNLKHLLMSRGVFEL